MTTNATIQPQSAGWAVQPAADTLIHDLAREITARCPAVEALASRLLSEAGIRLIDVLDHIVARDSVFLRRQLLDSGFTLTAGAGHVARHAGGIFPDVVLSAERQPALAMNVESVDEYAAVNGLSGLIVGAAGGTYRTALALRGDGVEFHVVERHGYDGYDVPHHRPEELSAQRAHLAQFRARRRLFDDTGEGFDHTEALVKGAVADLGADWACALFLRAERDFWESRNSAGKLQKARQDRLGIGWANDDHHTYDTSREWFRRTIDILELLGFVCRERFYAGAEAGWGSQILEQPVLGSVIFADIDLSPDELTGDFAHADLKPLRPLRRAGLWCALHGESMLEAGLNHLECTYDSKALRGQLETLGVPLMPPFSDFPHLYQQLTVGEWWPVRPDRIERLLREALITAEAAEAFRDHGAVGSHLENLERNQGFKGFNQPGISEVLKAIDPRQFV